MYLNNQRNTCHGQATVEAAFLLPLIFMAFMLLMQPAILLYDRIVMEAAAGKVARLAATSSSLALTKESFKEVALSYLGAIPPVALFHVHDESCSYEIAVEGAEAKGRITVTIINRVQPLPLISVAVNAIGLTDDTGAFVIRVTASAPTSLETVAVSK